MSAALDAVRLAEGILELRAEYEALRNENATLKAMIQRLIKGDCDDNQGSKESQQSSFYTRTGTAAPSRTHVGSAFWGRY